MFFTPFSPVFLLRTVIKLYYQESFLGYFIKNSCGVRGFFVMMEKFNIGIIAVCKRLAP